MKPFFKILILFILYFPLLAQDFESSGRDSVYTDEILVESNRIKMTNALAPNKIQVVDKQRISSLNGSRLYDALELSDALFVKDYGFNSGIKIISLNATQSEHTLILLDGVRLNSRQNAQVDLALYDLQNALRIEISKGGSSALYGSEAIGGVINIISDAALNKQFSVILKAGAGSYGLRNIFGKISHSLNIKSKNSLSYNVSFSDERAENKYKYKLNTGAGEITRERENSDYNSQVFNFNSTYIASNNTSLKLIANYSHFERGAPGIDLGYSTSTARQIDYNSLVSIGYSGKFSKVISLKTSVSHTYQLQKYFDPSTYNSSVIINSYYRLNSLTNASIVSIQPSEKFSVETGTELSFNNIESNDTEKGELLQAALFAAAKYVFKPGFVSQIIIYPSARYDYFSNINDKNVITGKLGINIKPFEKTGFHLKSSVGNNFSAPTFNELYWKNLGNKYLKPERSISFDAGVLYQFTALLQNEIEVSYFNVNTTDRIVWTPVAGVWRPLNVGKVKSEGIDAGLKSSLILNQKVNVSLRFNYTYGTAIKKNSDFPGDPSYNKQMVYIPKEMIKASFMFNYLTTSKLIKSLSFSLFYRFASKRYMNFENTSFAPRYDVLDANIGAVIKIFESELGLKFMSNNVFDEDYQVISGYPMPLRNYKFEISYKY